MHISCGVPQGSVLGPKLLLLDINDLVKVIKNCDYYIYAHDIVLFKKIRPEHRDADFTLFKQDIVNVTH